MAVDRKSSTQVFGRMMIGAWMTLDAEIGSLQVISYPGISLLQITTIMAVSCIEGGGWRSTKG